jgi:carbon storage regulator
LISPRNASEKDRPSVAAREEAPILILTRRIGEALRIGDETTVTVLAVKTGKQVSLGIRAPRSVAVHREELFNQLAQDQLTPSEPPIPDPVKPTVKIVIRNKKRQRVRTEAGE